MINIDEKIRKALQDADAELLEDFSEELSLLQSALGVLRNQRLWIVALALFYIVLFMATAVISAYQFFHVESTRAMIAWSIGFLASLLFVSMLKLWFWMEFNKHSVTREVKRVELQLARLVESLQASS